MVADTDKARARASEQATDWLILLQDDPDDPDLLQRFDAWLSESPLNAEAWTATDRVAGVIGRTPSSFSDRWRPRLDAYRRGEAIRPSPALGTALNGAGRSRQPSPRRLAIGDGVAGAALAACIAVLVVPGVILHLRADVVTGTGETHAMTLADGSTVVLAPHSAVRVAYSGAERRVDLLSGEAFFTVVHDPAKPFRVTAERVETTDLGTAFDVRRGADGASIAVQSGSVQVDDRSAAPPVSETLQAGQSVRVAWSGGAVRGEQSPGQVAAWRQNQLIAQDTPMRDVVDQLRPYFAGTILVADSDLAGRRVTGVYNLADPVDALQGIAQAHGAVVHRITPWMLVVTGG